MHTADPLQPRRVAAFLEYAQARGFHVDPTRVRRPRDKARVERSVTTVRDDCFAGEDLGDLAGARAHAAMWCREEYGRQVHTRTQRRPREQFEAEEQSQLRPAPPSRTTSRCGRRRAWRAITTPRSPRRSTRSPRATSARDGHGARRSRPGALLPPRQLIKVHIRQPVGGRATDVNDFPPEKAVYALRDLAVLRAQAAAHGPAIGQLAGGLLDGPLPWTRMRQVYALLGLVRRFGAARVEAVCAEAVAVDLTDIHRLRRMLEHAAPPTPPAPPLPVVPPAGALPPPPAQYALLPAPPTAGGAA